MKYVYAALLLHKLGKEIDENNMKKIVEASGTDVDESSIKTLVASLKGVDIDKAIAEAQPMASSAAPAAAKEEKKEEKVEERKEMVAEGLSALFG